jgi:hypothetical protein
VIRCHQPPRFGFGSRGASGSACGVGSAVEVDGWVSAAPVDHAISSGEGCGGVSVEGSADAGGGVMGSGAPVDHATSSGEGRGGS